MQQCVDDGSFDIVKSIITKRISPFFLLHVLTLLLILLFLIVLDNIILLLKVEQQKHHKRSIKHTHYTVHTIMSSSNEEELNALGYPKLQVKNPVPSDIEVSQQIVKEVGLLPIVDVGKQ